MSKVVPLISFIIPTYKTSLPFLRDAIESVIAQDNCNWEICIGDDGSCEPALTELLLQYSSQDSRIKVSISESNSGISSASNRAARLATGSYLALLDHDDVIAPQTVTALTEAVRLTPNADVLYTDEMKTDENGNVVGDYVKPDFSVDFLRSTMYLGHLLVLRRDLFESLGGLRSEFDGSQDFDLALRACTLDRVVVHVRQQLYRWRGSPSSTALNIEAKPWAVQKAKHVIEDFAAHLDWPTRAEEGMLPATFRLRYAIKPMTKVQIILASSGGFKRLSNGSELPLLVNAHVYLTTKTLGIDFHISAVAEQNVGHDMIDWCAANNVDLRHSETGGRQSVAQLLNTAIRESESEIVVILRDEIEVFDPEWLVALVELAQLPNVGAVGPRISYGDGSVRHVGLVYDDYEIKRCFHRMPVDVMEYQGFAHTIRNYAAVSDECIAFRRDAWDNLGGFDEAFQSASTTVDFCLRATLKGARIVYTPFSHVKYIGRIDSPVEPADIRLLADRYRSFRDPFFSPQLISTRSG